MKQTEEMIISKAQWMSVRLKHIEGIIACQEALDKQTTCLLIQTKTKTKTKKTK